MREFFGAGEKRAVQSWGLAAAAAREMAKMRGKRGAAESSCSTNFRGGVFGKKSQNRKEHFSRRNGSTFVGGLVDLARKI